MSNQTDKVNQFMSDLNHPLKAEVEAVRAIILGANPQITEHIKWNAPSFQYDDEDRVTFNLHRQDRIQLIFHRGAKVKASDDFAFEDSTGLLEWAAKDRGIVTLRDMQDVKAKEAALIEVVNQWIQIKE